MMKHKKGEHLHNLSAPHKQKIPAPTTKWYFAFGSNMDRARMFQRKAIWNYCCSGLLANHKLVFNKKSKKAGQGFANIIKSKKHQVEGILYRLEDSHLYKNLDKFECAGVHYNRVEKRVRRSDGQYITAFMYVAILTSNNLKPTEEYLNHLLKGERYLSPDYLSYLKSFNTAPVKDLKVFVYGTLKTGHGNHHRVAHATKIEKATINGKLYQSGLPYLTMDKEDWSTVGHADINVDRKNFDNKVCDDELKEECVHGELLTFSDWSVLRKLDSLEGYRPSSGKALSTVFENNHYTRVLATCVPDDSEDFQSEPCFVYIVSRSKVSGKDFVSDGIYRAKPIQYKQDELTRFEEGLDKHDFESEEDQTRFEEGLDKHDDYTDKSYDYLNRDYGIVNSITCKYK